MTLIDRAKAALEGATPGPWGITPHTTYKEDTIDGEFDNIGPVRVDYIYHVDDIWIVCPPPDADLIALAPDLARLAVAADELARSLASCIARLENLARSDFVGSVDDIDFERLFRIHRADLARFRAIAGGGG